MGTGLTCVGYGWTLLSITAAACVSAGFYIPIWLVGTISHEKNRLIAYFGSFRRCNYPTLDAATHKVVLIEQCARYSTFADIPSLFWQIATAAVATGACLAILIAFVAIPACCLKDIVSRTSALVMGIGQVLAAVCVGIGCILYPLGWDNKEVRDACGPHSGQYLLGTCTVGWSFYLMVGGAVLLLLCASLSTKSGKPIGWRKVPQSQPGTDEQSLLQQSTHSNIKTLNV
uniref:Lipoma HMGIC fusion partner-like protein n=1 Tax=Plectus sambesii TaxID=2011161 RepID=A0A914XKY0_9BILA